MNNSAISALEEATKRHRQFDDLIKASGRHNALLEQAGVASSELELIRRFSAAEGALAAAVSSSKQFETVFPSTALLEQTAARHTTIAKLLEVASLPTAEQYGLLPEILKSQQTHLTNVATQYGLQKVIEQMRTINDPWILKQAPATSMIGFAELTALHQTFLRPDPLRTHVQEIVDDALGDIIEFDPDADEDDMDADAIEAGAGESLIAFPKAQYGAVLIAAGFDFKFVMPKAPKPIEGAMVIHPYDATDHQIIYALERHFRELVMQKLSGIVGRGWFKQRVPSDVRNNCQERQDTARQKGEPIFELIEYADFSDIQKIVCRNDNWKEAFAPIFLHKEQTGLSLERLKPVRDAIAHNRGLGSVAKLTLASEAARLFTALGVAH